MALVLTGWRQTFFQLSFVLYVFRVSGRPERIIFGGGELSTTSLGKLKNEEKCREDQVYWLEDGKCYKKGERGPCSFGEILELDVRPLCKPAKENLINKIKECDGDKVLWTDGQCYQLASTGPCKEGSWLVLDSISSSGQPLVQCKKRTCGEGSVWWTEHCACVNTTADKSLIRSGDPCKQEGEVVLVTPYGNGICGCKSGFIKDDSGNCFEPGKRGSCGENEMFDENAQCVEYSQLSRRIFDLIPENEDPTGQIEPRYASRRNCRIDNNGVCRTVFNLRSRRGIAEKPGSFQNLIDWLDSFEKESNHHCKGKPCEDGKFYWDDGHCYDLATEGPCGDGRLFVVDKVDEGAVKVTCKFNRCPGGVWWAPTCSCISLPLLTDKTFSERNPCGPQEEILMGPYGHGVCGCQERFYRDDEGVCLGVDGENSDHLKLKIFDLVADNVKPGNGASLGRASLNNCRVDSQGKCRKIINLRNRIEDIDSLAEIIEHENESIISWLLGFPQFDNCAIPSREDDCHRQGKVLFEDGECYNLLERGPCFADEMWLVMAEEADGSLVPICKPRPCLFGGVLRHDDCQCYSRSAGDVCEGPHQQLVIDVFGRGLCACKGGFVVWGEKQQCQPLYEVGACGDNKSLVLDESAEAHCQNYNCTEGSGELQMNDGVCYLKGERGLCQEGYVVGLDPESSQPECISQVNTYLSFDDRNNVKRANMHNCVLDHRGKCTNAISILRRHTNNDKHVLFKEWIYSFQQIAPSRSKCKFDYK